MRARFDMTPRHASTATMPQTPGGAERADALEVDESLSVRG
jgi:hypothetical protein